MRSLGFFSQQITDPNYKNDLCAAGDIEFLITLAVTATGGLDVFKNLWE